MAEGWTKYLKKNLIDALSAGIETHGINPRAVKVMAEKGVDISGYKSKNISELKNIDFDYVITLCSHANEKCPIFTKKAKKIHKGFDDPPRLAQKYKNVEKKIDCYRKICNEIKEYINTLPESLS